MYSHNLPKYKEACVHAEPLPENSKRRLGSTKRPEHSIICRICPLSMSWRVTLTLNSKSSSRGPQGETRQGFCKCYRDPYQHDYGCWFDRNMTSFTPNTIQETWLPSLPPSTIRIFSNRFAISPFHTSSIGFHKSGPIVDGLIGKYTYVYESALAYIPRHLMLISMDLGMFTGSSLDCGASCRSM